MSYKFITSIVKSNFKRLSMPLKLSYAVTYRCNLKCRMCRIWDKDYPEPELEPGDLARFLEGARKLFWFGITGGEPFLRSDIHEIADVAFTQCPDLAALHFATNGTLQSRIEQFIRRFRQRHPRAQIVFTISIDGPTAMHDYIRGRQGVWKDAVSTFRFLKKQLKVKPQFGFTISHDNMDQFEPAFQCLKGAYPALEFDDMTVNIFQRSTFYYENHEMPGLDPMPLAQNIQRIRAMDQGPVSLNNFLRRQYLKLYLQYLKTNKVPLKCQSFSSTAFMDPYGNLFPCAVYHRKLLNIKEQPCSLKEAWQWDEARKIHQECARHQCPGCWSPCDAYSAIAGSLIPALIK